MRQKYAFFFRLVKFLRIFRTQKGIYMKQKNYNIPTVVYFVVTALLIAYFFPREGKIPLSVL